MRPCNRITSIGALTTLLATLTGCGSAESERRVPPSSAFTVGGTVAGLTGSLILQNNGGDNLTVSANGSFLFGNRVPAGAPFAVAVMTQPAGQVCTIQNGSGTAVENVARVRVTCEALAPDTVAIGGTVRGLTGTLVLQNNGTDMLTVSANGGFVFGSAVKSGTAYAVTVLAQPDGQLCSLQNAVGIATASVTDVLVDCVTQVTTLTGEFAGQVRGLRYQTATQSGFTDATGRFAYLPGESVTFSVGGVSLGTAEGAAQVSLFTLLRLEPPRTVAALRAELATTEDLTDFDRVANRAMFLVALDNDRDASNGLDVTGWDAKLTGATLSFEHPMYRFALESMDEVVSGFPFDEFSRFVRRHGLNPLVPVQVPLVNLYRALQIPVPVPALAAVTVTATGSQETAREEHDYDTEGRLSRTFTVNSTSGTVNRSEVLFSYGANARPEFRMERADRDGDGTFERIEATTFTYDAAGRLISKSDEDGDHVELSREDFVYDQAGNRILQRSTLFGAGGNPPRIESISSEFDAARNVIRRFRTSDADADGVPDRRATFTFSHDARGNILESIDEDDANADGIVDSVHRDSAEYDAAGHLVESESTRDCATCTGGRELNYRQTQVYDDAGRPLTNVVEEFAPEQQGGAREFLQVVRGTRDGRGAVTRVEIVRESVAERGRQEAVFTYDSLGHVMATSLEDFDGDGNLIIRFTQTYTRDEQQRLLTVLSQQDRDGDGAIDSTRTETREYRELADGLGELILEYARSDLDVGFAAITTAENTN